MVQLQKLIPSTAAESASLAIKKKAKLFQFGLLPKVIILDTTTPKIADHSFINDTINILISIF